MGTLTPNDTWSAGNAYELYMGRWSRPVARLFLEWLAVPQGLRWLDVGCGTGALSAAIVDTGAAAAITAVDPSAGFLAAAQAQLGSKVIEVISIIATQDNSDGTEVNKAQVVAEFVVVAHQDATVVLQPGKEPFDLPAPLVAA